MGFLFRSLALFLPFKPNCILSLMVAFPWSWFFSLYCKHCQHSFLFFLTFNFFSLFFFITLLIFSTFFHFLTFTPFPRLSPFLLQARYDPSQRQGPFLEKNADKRMGDIPMRNIKSIMHWHGKTPKVPNPLLTKSDRQKIGLPIRLPYLLSPLSSFP